MLAMTSLVSIAAAATSIQIITPVDIVKMSAEGTAFQLQAGYINSDGPITFSTTPASLLTLEMKVAMDSPYWSVEFDSNYPSLELSSAMSSAIGLMQGIDEAGQAQSTTTYSWSISSGFAALETGLIFTEHISEEISANYWVKVEVLGSAQEENHECTENEKHELKT